jgi:PAS domain S-box-containing protein
MKSPGLKLTRPRRRDWYWLTPLLAIALFVAMMMAVFWWLNTEDAKQRHEALVRDMDWSQQSVRLRLQSTQDQLVALARAIGQDQMKEVEFQAESRDLLTEKPELVLILFVDTDRRARWVGSADAFDNSRFRAAGAKVEDPEAFWAFDQARDTRRAVYSRPYLGANNDVYLEMQAPVFQQGRFVGTVGGVYSVTGLLNYAVPEEIAKRYTVTMVDEGGNTLASTLPRPISEARMWYEVPVDPPGRGILLRAYAYRTPSDLSKTMLLWVVAGLSAIIIWSLFALWRHTRRRSQAERALIAETAFRRAMENSMLTGMRAFDLQGRIVYVNPAFCRMIGWSEQEIVGTQAPFPYWPTDRQTVHRRNLDMVLSGQAPPNGFEVEVLRKDGTRFFARMYVSPLIDQYGVQTGWMTSMTDITEPKRIREELAVAHERFTTVLEGLEDAISVVAPGEGELLFANRTYRKLFGNQPGGHTELATASEWPLENAAETPIECYSPTTDRWFDVRHRLLQWVDGRMVWMQVAADITERRNAAEVSRTQQEKIQLTSRLITMGEMASSLAHELNQPLTAIASYSMGTAARVKSGKATPADLLPALEKTSAQAERAGMIIRRIREFVKKSEPKKHRVSIRSVVEDAVGFAEIEAQKKRARIQTKMEPDLPDIEIDPIMIEQVLLNLLKNAIEAMEGLPERKVVLDVHRQDDMLECAVIDRGHGIDPKVREKLFEPFYSTKNEGMGMGLNICRTIIEFHHGRLWAEDNPQGGTIFRFTLPFARAKAAAE